MLPLVSHDSCATLYFVVKKTLNLTLLWIATRFYWRHQYSEFISQSLLWLRGSRWRICLRQCPTSRKVAGPIPYGVIRISHCLNPSGRTMTLGSTQPLTEMSTRNPSWVVKAVGAWGSQPCYFMCRMSENPGRLNLLDFYGSVQGCFYLITVTRT